MTEKKVLTVTYDAVVEREFNAYEVIESVSPQLLDVLFMICEGMYIYDYDVEEWTPDNIMKDELRTHVENCLEEAAVNWKMFKEKITKEFLCLECAPMYFIMQAFHVALENKDDTIRLKSKEKLEWVFENKPDEVSSITIVDIIKNKG